MENENSNIFTDDETSQLPRLSAWITALNYNFMIFFFPNYLQVHSENNEKQ